MLICLFLVGVAAQAVVHECHHPVTFNPQNTYPIVDAHRHSTLVAQVPNGKLYSVALPQMGTSFWLTHLYGTPYERAPQQHLGLSRVAGCERARV